MPIFAFSSFFKKFSTTKKSDSLIWSHNVVKSCEKNTSTLHRQARFVELPVVRENDESIWKCSKKSTTLQMAARRTTLRRQRNYAKLQKMMKSGSRFPAKRH